jgi:hypothetical protein
MSKQENYEENNPENTITYVYVPDEQLYGTVVQYGAWASLIEYYEDGVGYKVEIPNDEFIVVDEIGIGYLEETEKDL